MHEFTIHKIWTVQRPAMSWNIVYQTLCLAGINQGENFLLWSCIEVKIYHAQLIHLCLHAGSDKTYYTAVYANLNVASRRLLWEELNRVGIDVDRPWCVGVILMVRYLGMSGVLLLEARARPIGRS